jgi:alanine racemase
MRRTCLEVSRDAFRKNVLEIKKLVNNTEIMPVVKANAYGTYLNKDISLMNEFGMVAVAIVDEAIQLRKLGYEKDIFVLNQPYVEEIEEILNNNIIVGVSSTSFLEKTKDYDKKIRVHVELETGMGRTGVLDSCLDDFISVLKNSNVLVEGVYTHLSSADIDYDFTNKQINIFNKNVSLLKKEFSSIKYVHCAASNGILNFDLGICNLVRPGLILYGYPSCMSAVEKIKLEPVLKFKSSISFIKEINVGDAVSYGRSFVADRKMLVATVGCGYADGVMRKLSNKGCVSVNGKRCKILGNVCMDSFMIDVTDVDCKVGDFVYLFDNEIVTLNEISNICETINYEVISTISDRVPRIFID